MCATHPAAAKHPYSNECIHSRSRSSASLLYKSIHSTPAIIQDEESNEREIGPKRNGAISGSAAFCNLCPTRIACMWPPESGCGGAGVCEMIFLRCVFAKTFYHDCATREVALRAEALRGCRMIFRIACGPRGNATSSPIFTAFPLLVLPLIAWCSAFR